MQLKKNKEITMKRQTIVLFLLLIIILSPSISKCIGIGNICSINENRKRVPFPNSSDLYEKGFLSINDWFNDNFGLRDFFIRAQHQIDYSIFGYSKELFFSHVGDDEYLHYRSVIAKEQIANEKMTEETQQEIIDKYLEVKNYLQEKEVALKLIIVPQKNEILDVADQLPVVRPEYNMYYKMQDKAINEGMADSYVNIADVLMTENEKAPVFYKTDFHWNDWGAAVAFGKVVNSYANDKGMGEVYDTSALKYEGIKLGSNEAQMSNLSLFFYNMPEEITVNCNREQYSEAINDDDFPEYSVWENNFDPIFNENVLIIGDSYTQPVVFNYHGTHCGIVELFHKVYFCHWNNSKGALTDIPQDVELVIIERIESGYTYLSDYLDGLLKEN